MEYCDPRPVRRGLARAHEPEPKANHTNKRHNTSSSAHQARTRDNDMKLHVTIESQTYEVEVDVVDPNAPLASADLRVQSCPSSPRPKPPAGRMIMPGMNGNGNGSKPVPTPNVQPTLVTTEAAPALVGPPEPPLPPKPAWHGLGVGAPGEVCSPIPGIITNVNVKVGDAHQGLRPHRRDRDRPQVCKR